MYFSKTSRNLALAAICISAFGLTSAQAAFPYDQNVTGEVIFGTGVENGGFTVNQNSGIELGLRGKLRFDVNNNPQNLFNSNGDGTYSFNTGAAPDGFSFDLNSPTTPIWNFEWSINSNFDGSGGNLNSFNYLLEMDFDPSLGTNFQSFDPIKGVALADHAIGTNATAQSAGAEAANPGEYASLIANNNLAQNSWNMEFFNDGLYSSFDPTVDGTYNFALSAYDPAGSDSPIARTEIQIIVGNGGSAVPDSGSAALLLSAALLGLIGVRRFSNAAKK